MTHINWSKNKHRQEPAFQKSICRAPCKNTVNKSQVTSSEVIDL